MTPLAINFDQISRFARKYQGLIQALRVLFLYAFWIVLVKLIFLSFTTYVLVSSSATRSPHFDEISDALGATEITVMAISALLFVGLMRWLNPITTTTSEEIFTRQRFERRFLPGYASGTLLGIGIIFSFILSGIYRYLGVFIQFDEAPLAVLGVVVRIAALAVFAYCEEFIFRHKILPQLRTLKKGFAGAILAVVLTAFSFCAIKTIQFDLGFMHLLTLFLISCLLGFRYLLTGDFAWGGGFWSAVLILFQPLLSLPILGNEFSGVVLIKYYIASDSSELAQSAANRFLTGGAGGPVSSFAFQLVLALGIARGVIAYKKSLSKT